MSFMSEADFAPIACCCSTLIKSSTIENMEVLLCACKSIKSSSLQNFQEYIVFPLRLTLFRQHSENVKIKCIECLTYIFSQTSLTSWAMFRDIYVQLFRLISNPNNISDTVGSEELKWAVCDCAEKMVVNSDNEVIKQMYGSEFALPLAHSIFVLLQLLKSNKSKALWLATLKTIGAVTCCNSLPTEDVRKIVSEPLKRFLPGVSIAMQDVTCKDDKQGHMVIINGLNIFANYLTLTVGDCVVNNEVCTKSKTFLKSSNNLLVDANYFSPTETIANKLEIIIKNIAVLVSHDHWKVREALTKWSASILLRCSENLSNCISILLRILLTLSVDGYDEVSETSRAAIQKVCAHLNKLNSVSLCALLEEEVFVLSSKLVKTHLMSDDVQKLTVLKMLHGYLRYLGTSVDILLQSHTHLDNLILSLIHLLDFDYNSVNFLKSSTTHDFNLSLINEWPKKKFKYFDDERIVGEISEMFFILTCNGNIRLCIDYLCEKYYEYKQSNQCIFLINTILRGLSRKIKLSLVNSDEKTVFSVDHDEIFNVTEDITDFFLSDEAFSINYVETSKREVNDSCEQVLRICLILEGIAISSEILNEKFKNLLQKILCPVMEKAGHFDSVISETGNLTLFNIAYYCNYYSISKLIDQNIDYIISNIMIKFHWFHSSSEAAAILNVVLQYCSCNVLLLLNEVINQVLAILDSNQNKAVYLLTVIKSILNKYSEHIQETNSEATCKSNSKLPATDTSFSSIFMKHHALQTIETEITDEVAANDMLAIISSDSVVKENTVLLISTDMMLEILERCVHFLCSNDTVVSVLTLEIISTVISCTKNENDKILPLIHKLWDPFVATFTENYTVACKAFQTLLVITKACSDFIQSRTVKNILPKILKFLKHQSHISLNNSNLVNYQFTGAYKYQLLTLKNMGQLAVEFNLLEKELEMVVLICIVYLSEGQPVALQHAAKSSLKELETIDSDAIWFYLKEPKSP